MIYITHYYYPGTDPWKNIMNLPKEEAFEMAAKLAAIHPDTMSFGRFADFENYYPDRKKADDHVRESFIRLGGKPKLMHPYSFTLMECEYLRNWFSEGDKIVLNLSDIPDDQISFTIGDSCAQITNGMEPEVLTKEMLMKRISDCGNSVEAFLKASLGKFAYVEVQLWYRPSETEIPKQLELINDDYLGHVDFLRHACRGILLNGDKVLLCYESNNDKYIIPGGGVEENETYVECCEREMLEETGMKVKAVTGFLDVEELFDVWRHINHYFICELIEDTGIRSLTEGEKRAGYTCVWKTIDEAMEIFGKYEEYHDTDIACYGLYRREYMVLSELRYQNIMVG